jgi:hypothetical protein
MKKNLIRNGIFEDRVSIVDDYRLMEIQDIRYDTIIFAIGNIVGHGEKIIQYIEGIGEEYV